MPNTTAADRQHTLMSLTGSLSALGYNYRATAKAAVAHLDLSHAMAWPLVMIGREGNGIRSGDLARVLGVAAPSIVRQIDQLVDMGLVERRDDDHDRRVKTLHITAAGNRRRLKIEAVLQALREELFADISDDDLVTTLRVLRTLDSRLGRGGADSSSESEP